MRSRPCRLGSVALALATSSLLGACSGASSPPPSQPEPAATAAPATPTAEPAPAATPGTSSAPEPAPTAEPAAALPKKSCPSINAMAPDDGSFWRALVAPRACWTLVNQAGGKANPADVIVVESYDARRVGDADVARLRYTRATAAEETEINDKELLPLQIAVTDSGVFFFEKRADDTAIGRALKKPPAYANPPKPMEPAKSNGWKFVRTRTTAKGPVVCFGHETPPSEGKCGDHCSGMICVSPKSGVVLVDGTASPTFETFLRDGFKLQ